jgi:hypothetical protein
VGSEMCIRDRSYAHQLSHSELGHHLAETMLYLVGGIPTPLKNIRVRQLG